MKTESDARACETLAGPSRLEKIDFEGLPIVRWLSCSPGKLKKDAWSQVRLVW